MVHRLLLSFGGRRRRIIPCLLFTDFLSLCDSSYAIPFVQSLSLRDSSCAIPGPARFLLCDPWTCAIPPVQSLNLAVSGRPGAGQGNGQKGSYGGGIVS